MDLINMGQVIDNSNKIKIYQLIPPGKEIDKEKSNLDTGEIVLKDVEISWQEIIKDNPFYESFVCCKDINILSYIKLKCISWYLNKGWNRENTEIGWLIKKDERNGYTAEFDEWKSLGTIYFDSKDSANLAIYLMGDDLKYII